MKTQAKSKFLGSEFVEMFNKVGAIISIPFKMGAVREARYYGTHIQVFYHDEWADLSAIEQEELYPMLRAHIGIYNI